MSTLKSFAKLTAAAAAAVAIGVATIASSFKVAEHFEEALDNAAKANAAKKEEEENTEQG